MVGLPFRLLIVFRGAEMTLRNLVSLFGLAATLEAGGFDFIRGVNGNASSMGAGAIGVVASRAFSVLRVAAVS